MISLAIVVALILFVVSLRQARKGETGSVRRLFLYVLEFGLLMAIAGAASDLIRLALDADVFDRRDTLASALATLTVAVPVYLGLGYRLWKRLADPAEAASPPWELYVNATLLISLVWTMSAATAVGIRLIRGVQGDEWALAALPVWLAVYLSHRWLRSRRPGRGLDVIEVFGGSAFGLGFAAVGAGMVIAWSLNNLLFRDQSVLLVAGRNLPTGVVPLAIGGAAWWYFWFRDAIDRPRTVLWQLQVVLLGSAAALTTALVSLGWAIFRVMEWWWGDPASTFADQFDSLPGLVAAGGIGLAVWWYHRLVLTSGERVTGTVRLLAEYALTGVALVAAVVAFSILFAALVVVLFPTGEIGTLSDRDVVLGAVAALIVALPTWWYYWAPRQRVDEAEETSAIRRGFLITIFGLGGVVAISALIALLFELFRAIIDGSFTAATIAGAREPIGILAAVGLAAWYHWTVWRRERHAEAEPPPVPSRAVVLVGFTRDTARRLRERAPVRVVEVSLGRAPVEVEVDQILEIVSARDGDLILTPGDGPELVRVERASTPT